MSIHGQAYCSVEIAVKFERLADVRELQSDNPFRIRTYRNAARVIAGHAPPPADLVAEGAGLDKLPGVDEAIAKEMTTIVKTGRRTPRPGRAQPAR